MKEHDLDRLRVRRPCPKTFGELEGAGARRFCGECGLHVTNLSALTRAEAERVVEDSGGELCATWRVDARGRKRFADDPEPTRRRFVRAAAALVGFLPFLAACRDRAAPRTEEPSEPAVEERAPLRWDDGTPLTDEEVDALTALGGCGY